MTTNDRIVYPSGVETGVQDRPNGIGDHGSFGVMDPHSRVWEPKAYLPKPSSGASESATSEGIRGVLKPVIAKKQIRKLGALMLCPVSF